MTRFSAFARSTKRTTVFPSTFKPPTFSKIDEHAPANKAGAKSHNKGEEGDQHQPEGHEGVNLYDDAFTIENAKDLEIPDDLTPNFLVEFNLHQEDRTSKYH